MLSSDLAPECPKGPKGRGAHPITTMTICIGTSAWKHRSHYARCYQQRRVIRPTRDTEVTVALAALPGSTQEPFNKGCLHVQSV
jgi:hypothetical protein